MGFRDDIKLVLGRWRRTRALLKGRHRDSEEDSELAGLDHPPDMFLRPDQQKKITVLAKILGKSEARTAAELFSQAISGLPDRPLSSFLLPTIKIKSCERVSEDLIRIALKNGRAFFGQRSNEKEYLLYNTFKFYLPEAVDGDAYKLAFDIERRYLMPKLAWYRANARVMVEGGCFTGMKAIRWHDLAAKPVRILAVEIGKANSEILAANIRENGLDNAIVPIHAGLWRESGEGTQKHSFSTRRFLESSDNWQKHMVHEEKVQLLTIGDLLDKYEVDVADYFNIQVNGAEIEVLKGALKSFERVKIFDIAAYYSKDGKQNLDVVREILTENGCTILRDSGLGRITAVTQKFRDEILACKPKNVELP